MQSVNLKMIPKIIHLIWFGNKRPEKFDFTLNEIKRINNDYEIKEWNDNNIDFELVQKDFFNKTENLGSKSDILRFELLNKYGGIYMDYDFIQIKKFDELLDYDFFIGSGNENETWNSIVGSIPNHKICKDFLHGLSSTTPVIKNDNGDEVGMVMSKTGPYYIHKIYSDNNSLSNIKHLSKNYFFPFPGGERDLVKNFDQQSINYIKSFATQETICIHFHTCTWQ
jgi:mannosyltransferase OCH1-like enzyme